MPISAEQYRTAIDTQRTLVRRGWHPSAAGAIVRRALGRVKSCCGSCRGGGSCCSDGGLGKVHQTRSLRRDLDPSIKPRQVIAGEQCVRIQEIPGGETSMYQQLDNYRNRGWNVMEIESTKGWPSVRVFWACPPGRTPMEAQNQVLASSPWGPPLLGATTVPTAPVAVAGAPGILANVAAAGDDPSVVAARNLVSKWSWIIPVGGLLMSAKRKVSEWRTPVSAAIVGRRH